MSSRHIAIIPARAGSKSIPHKNLIKLPDNRGETITRIAVDNALQSGIFSHVVLSTDIPKQKVYLDGVGRGVNAMTKFECIKRPGNLCTDKALMIEVVKHAMEYLGNAYEYVWVLQPTSPIRDKRDFEVIKRVIESEKFNSVISFKKMKEQLQRAYTVTQDDDGDFVAHPLRYVNYDNKEELKTTWTRSGNFYVTRKDLIKEYNTLENKPIACYPVSRAKGVNIDDREDLVMCKHYIADGAVKL
jgi:CMP-N,N'-diacetyllegionaminic acid synthase